MSQVAVLAAGMATASGLTAPAACAAFRARIENFNETRFISESGEWIVGAEVPLPTPWRGLARHVHLLAGPIRECFEACPNADPEKTALLLCVAEPERPGRLAGLDDELPRRLVSVTGYRFAKGSRMLAFGQAGGAVALQGARELLASGQVQHVIVAGVDSFLMARTITAYDRQDRLLTPANSNGFIPGEAGAAVILGKPAPGSMVLRGIGLGQEKAYLGSGEPLRADGLVGATNGALKEAGIAIQQVNYRIADITGEQYYFKEAALALVRIQREGGAEPIDVWTPVDCFGHTGAAVVPAMAAISLDAARKGYAPGPTTMMIATDDRVRRSAIVLSWQG